LHSKSKTKEKRENIRGEKKEKEKIEKKKENRNSNIINRHSCPCRVRTAGSPHGRVSLRSYVDIHAVYRFASIALFLVSSIQQTLCLRLSHFAPSRLAGEVVAVPGADVFPSPRVGHELAF
jgi:hypothetical protein